MQHTGAGLSSMLLHKSAFREMLSCAEQKRLDFWKIQIRKKMDKHPYAECVQWMKYTLRKSQSFRQGFLSCGDRDLGHFAVLHAIRSNNLNVLRFLIEARDPFRFCQKHQGTTVLYERGGPAMRLMPNAIEDDEPYLYSAILYGTPQCVEQLLRMLGGSTDGIVHLPANGFCQNTTFLSLALRQLCTSTPSRIAQASEKVKCLLLHGANPMLPDAFGATSLTVYCEYAAAVRADTVLKGMLYEKLSNAEDKKRMWAMVTLLSSSTFSRTLGLTMTDSRMWMESGACNPLQIPAANGNTWLLYVLLHGGVKLDTVNHLGQNALFASNVNRVLRNDDGAYDVAGAGVVFESTRPTAVVTTPIVSLNFLIRHGINTRQIDSEGCTPIIHLLLHYPYSDYLYQKIDVLYKGGVDVEHISQQKHTALSLAQRLANFCPDTFNCILQLVSTLIKQNRTLLHQDMYRTVWDQTVFPIPFHLPHDMFDMA